VTAPADDRAEHPRGYWRDADGIVHCVTPSGRRAPYIHVVVCQGLTAHGDYVYFTEGTIPTCIARSACIAGP